MAFATYHLLSLTTLRPIAPPNILGMLSPTLDSTPLIVFVVVGFHLRFFSASTGEAGDLKPKHLPGLFSFFLQTLRFRFCIPQVVLFSYVPVFLPQVEV
jgi:hypothetical protein